MVPPGALESGREAFSASAEISALRSSRDSSVLPVSTFPDRKLTSLRVKPRSSSAKVWSIREPRISAPITWPPAETGVAHSW